MKTNRFWVFALGAVLLVSVIAAVAVRLAPAGEALTFSNGVLVMYDDLATTRMSYSYTVAADADGTFYNVISVERGRIRVSEANCPDKACVRQGWLSGGVMPIVCLPHRLVIRLEGSWEAGFDAIVG